METSFRHKRRMNIKYSSRFLAICITVPPHNKLQVCGQACNSEDCKGPQRAVFAVSKHRLLLVPLRKLWTLVVTLPCRQTGAIRNLFVNTSRRRCLTGQAKKKKVFFDFFNYKKTTKFDFFFYFRFCVLGRVAAVGPITAANFKRTAHSARTAASRTTQHRVCVLSTKEENIYISTRARLRLAI